MNNTILDEGWVTKKSGKYSISIPADWSFREDDKGFFVTSPLSEPNDTFAENVNLTVQIIGNMTIDEYMDLSKKQLVAMNVSDLRIIFFKDKTEIECGFKYGDIEVKYIQYVWLENGKAYLLTYTDSKDAFGVHINLARRVLNSFKMSR